MIWKYEILIKLKIFGTFMEINVALYKTLENHKRYITTTYSKLWGFILWHESNGLGDFNLKKIYLMLLTFKCIYFTFNYIKIKN